ncbi:hypothetical protein HMPREF0650_0430 [Hoylesella buccalis ATCC 35310]|uniref:Uncharacterized protein n=1 Tax=Hoylesella buccalis ATCC 35310 TaxID=679190 RepID=D1W779_9BACT|nr:hypothetical protein HMPREF0650_0430 [Hoylesella buccalis ATCC 35310]
MSLFGVYLFNVGSMAVACKSSAWQLAISDLYSSLLQFPNIAAYNIRPLQRYEK